MPPTKKEFNLLSRREFLQLSASAAVAMTFASCAGLGGGASGGRTVKIGYVTPQTGPLASFGEADEFILAGIRQAFGEGLNIAGTNYPIEILVKDTQSDPNRAADVAADLILQDNIDLMVVASTPETTNPVSDQCEVNGVPCISTMAPWQPWFFRNPDAPATGYEWTYHYFWGLEDIIAVFIDIWNSIDNNKVVGGLWPNDGDGLAWGDAELGFPPALEAAGFTVVDPGRYENLKDDFSVEIAAFKEAGVEIVTGVMLPPDLGTFLTQASQQGFNPKMFTVGKAALYPSVVQSLSNDLGNGLTTEIWWTPNHPFGSSLVDLDSKGLADAYSADTGKQWTQPIGFIHSLFEVAADVLTRTADIDDKASIVEAIKATNLDTIVGNVSWGSGPFPNVAKTVLAGGQWQAGGEFPLDLTVTTNTTAPIVPVQGANNPMPWSQ